jgi:hypothetical protein
MVPDAKLMGDAYAAFKREVAARPEVEQVMKRLADTPLEVLAIRRVLASLDEHPARTWDAAVRWVAILQKLPTPDRRVER